MERGPNRYALYFWLEDTEGSPKLSYLLIRKENGVWEINCAAAGLEGKGGGNDIAVRA